MNGHGAIGLLVAAMLLPSEASGFGTKRAHEELALSAVEEADQDGRIETYLRESLDLQRGRQEPLAVQFGLDPRVDEDLITDFTNMHGIITRLNRSRSLDDEDDVGPVEYPFAPGDSLAFFDQSCRNAPDFDTCFAALERASVARLIAIGTYAEDNPNPRSRHHFHDPERAHGPFDNYGLDDSNLVPGRIVDEVFADFVAAGYRGGSWLRAIASFFGISSIENFGLRGRSAVDRVLNTTRGGGLASDEFPENLFALPDAERYLYRALTYPAKDERENYLALHFIALGHVLHLLQDMGSVAHVRNDFIVDHVLVDRLRRFLGTRSLESAGDDRDVFSSVLTAVGSSLLNVPTREVILSGRATVPSGFFDHFQEALDPTDFDTRDFWDRDPSGAPDDTDPSRSGLAERVHNRFLSAGTLSNTSFTGGYERPNLPLWSLGFEVGTGQDAVRAEELPERNLETGALTDVTSRFLASRLVPHLARCNYHCFYGAPIGLGYSVIDESVQRDYLELLFPLVIDYGAKFLQHYLAPRVEVVPTGPGEFTLRNLTALPFTADADAIEIAYTAADPSDPEGVRARAGVSCDASEFTLPAKPASGSAPLGTFTCTLPPTLPEPPLRRDYWVIVRGQLGERGEAGTAAEFDTGIAPKDFVVAFDHVQPEILFQSETTPAPEATSDAEVQTDLIAVPADLSRSVASPDESPALRNLGNVLRPALANRFSLDPSQVALLDFISPSAEPGGNRVAFALDLEQARGAVEYGPNDVWILDLANAPEDEQSLTIVPEDLPVLRTVGVRWVAWNRDGVTDDLVFGLDQIVDPTGGFFEWFGVDGVGGGPRRGAADYATSTHGPLMIAIPNNIGGLGILDIKLMSIATGADLFSFDLPSLSVHPSDGPTPPPVPGGAPDAWENEAEFSPDGSRVVFTAAPIAAAYQGGQLYVAELSRSMGVITGGSLRRVGTTERALSPIWSPDGEWIVYQDAVVHDLFAIRAAGGENPVRLTFTGSLSAANLTWLEPLALPTGP